MTMCIVNFFVCFEDESQPPGNLNLPNFYPRLYSAGFVRLKKDLYIPLVNILQKTLRPKSYL